MSKFHSILRSLAVFSVLLGLGSGAQAAVVYYGANVTTPVGASYDESGIWFGFLDGVVGVKSSGSGGNLAGRAGQFQLMFNSAAGYLNLVARPSVSTFGSWSNNTFNGVERLESGESVEPTDVFTSAFTIMASTESFVNEWDDFGRGFIGVTFSNELGQVFYGYADVTVNTDYTATLHGFAYENTPGTAITTGAIPEPSAALLSVSALGVLLILRKRV